MDVKVHSRSGDNVVHQFGDSISIFTSPPGSAARPLRPPPSFAAANNAMPEELRPFKWFPWLVPSFVVANVVLFIIIMHVNNCPKNSGGSCVAKFLGRFSFQPLKENPLLGPSSSTLLSALFIKAGISVGASGALFGLLGSMLSELITNWSMYANKVAVLLTLLVIIVINLAVGILPHVDNFAHIGGFISGFLLGFVFFIRPQFGWVSQRYASSAYTGISVKPKHKPYQYVLWVLSFVLLVAGLTTGLVLILRGVNMNDHCSWCHYMSCVPTSKWNCKSQQVYCKSNQIGNQLN